MIMQEMTLNMPDMRRLAVTRIEELALRYITSLCSQFPPLRAESTLKKDDRRGANHRDESNWPTFTLVDRFTYCVGGDDEYSEMRFAKRPKRCCTSKLSRQTAQHHARGTDALRLIPIRTIALTFGTVWKVMALSVMQFTQSDVTATQREFYYCLLRWFKRQSQLNEALLDAAGAVQLPREALGVTAAARGFVYGPLTIVITNANGSEQLVDCHRHPQVIPSSLLTAASITFRCDARLIMVIEKEGIFRQLVEDRLCDKISCVLVTGLGYPSYSCRLLTSELAAQLALPVLGLFDYNPHGLSILLAFKFGSARAGSSVGSRATPAIRWMGLLTEDVKQHVPPELLQDFSPRDTQIATSLLTSEFMLSREDYFAELVRMRNWRKKAELQSLNRLDPNFLSQVFIPQLLARQRFL